MLADVIRSAAVRFDGRPAICSPGGWSYSYAELDETSDRVAVAMAVEWGVREGDVVALVLPSSVEFVVYYAAAAKLGAITAGVNPHLTAPERRAVLDVAQPRLVVARRGLADGAPGPSSVLEIDLADAPAGVGAGVGRTGTPDAPAADLDRPVAICFTSGSTGQPKGAVFTTRQLRAISDLDTGGAWGSGAPSIIGTQLAHIGGMTKLPWLLAGGAPLFVLERWRADDVLELTAEHRMSALNAGPTQVTLLLRSTLRESLDLGGVRAIIAGTGPSSPALIAEAREAFRCRYSVRYSSTECGGVGLATALDAPDEEALHTVGRPRDGVEAKLVDGDGNHALDGDVGEIWLRSPAVMHSYWRDPDATAATLVGGWLRTGDLARRTPSGCYQIAGRTKEMYIRGGYNVYPVEVEAVLCGHPAVDEVVVVPHANEVMGEIGIACVVPRRGQPAPTLDELRAHGAGSLAPFKLPEGLVVVERLPLNASDKVDRRSLRAMAESELGRPAPITKEHRCGR